MYMAMFVLNDPDRLYEVLDAWEAEGITGITISESTGLYRARTRFIPMRFLSPLVEREVSHLTLVAMVRDEDQVQACLRAAEAVVGDLSGNNTGVFGAWPLSLVKGLEKEGH